jgi:hypothetical protein
MKIVFSRKGVDSTAGKCASPLVQGRPISLPIPTGRPTPTAYGQLRSDLHAMARDLSAGALSEQRPCHLDPDIDRTALDTRPAGWRGALGQVSSALSHLRNHNVGAGDLFLFWGLYRAAEPSESGWRYCGPRQHAMFGWLSVEAVCDIAANLGGILPKYPWLAEHPHVQPGWVGSNAVYVAAQEFTLAGRCFPGSGVFQKAFRLTETDSRLPSVWSVPSWLDKGYGGVGMSYHPPGRWLGKGRLQSAARGQEFVADVGERVDAKEWIAELLEAHR